MSSPSLPLEAFEAEGLFKFRMALVAPDISLLRDAAYGLYMLCPLALEAAAFPKPADGDEAWQRAVSAHLHP
jgi:hypothetical protein